MTLSGVASLAAALVLCLLAVLPRPGFSFTHGDILSGAQILSAEQRSDYLAYVRQNLTWDSIYLLLQVIVWCGLAATIARKNRLTAAFVLVIGVLGAFLDLAENSIRWAFLTMNGAPSGTLAFVWSVTFAMSFWFMAVAAVAAATALGSRMPGARLAVLAGFAVIPASALIFTAGYKPLFFWMIAWHVVIGIFLIRNPSEARRESAPVEPTASA
jgi:hypothetical protein